MMKYKPAEITDVNVLDGVFAPRIETNRTATIPMSIRRCRETGRIDAFLLQWKEGKPNRPHIFWDSDVAKVLEGMAYSIRLHPDPAMKKELDELVDLVIASQRKDGYLNSYFTAVAPERRWTALFHDHELYCAGHLMEAAVAHFETTGNRKFLDAMCRYADCIAAAIGPKKGQIPGYPGHEEIELALCKLAKATGESKYFDLAKYFIDERGREPNYFKKEMEAQSDKRFIEDPAYYQAHKPVREQTEAVGHAVRAVYLYTGMADVAEEAGDADLLKTCETLFEDIRSRKMYLTGGIGATRIGEAFENAYNLPNNTAYAECCAAIGLVFFCQRMLHITGDAKYADVMERALYNGLLSGISLSGDEFFYQNMLEVNETSPYCKTRQKWFDCSCCPTNFCRFLPQIGSLLWSVSSDGVRLNIPAASELKFRDGAIRVFGKYPYDGDLSIRFSAAGRYSFSLRVPDWNRGFTLRLNRRMIEPKVENGYLVLNREWKKGDLLDLELRMPVTAVHSNPKVAMNTGKIALTRGPLVYALESIDNSAVPNSLILSPFQPFRLGRVTGLPSGTVAIKGDALTEIVSSDELYPAAEPVFRHVKFTAIPYALWQNRGPAQMNVWIREMV